MTAMKDMLCTSDNGNEAAINNKEPRIMNLEELLKKLFPDFRAYFNSVTFCPTVMSHLLRAQGVVLKKLKIQLAVLQMLIAMMMYSSKGGNAAYDTDVGKQTECVCLGVMMKYTYDTYYRWERDI